MILKDNLPNKTPLLTRFILGFFVFLGLVFFIYVLLRICPITKNLILGGTL